MYTLHHICTCIYMYCARLCIYMYIYNAYTSRSHSMYYIGGQEVPVRTFSVCVYCSTYLNDMWRKFVWRVYWKCSCAVTRPRISKALHMDSGWSGGWFECVGQSTGLLGVQTTAVFTFRRASNGRIAVVTLWSPLRGRRLAGHQWRSVVAACGVGYGVGQGLIEAAVPQK